jgi:TetR/AcrR family transcriptional repressor of nem operon
VARPIEFDLEKARQSAMMLFWRKGYLASSLSDLLREMAITRGSFYAAFGDKRMLFVECLDLFAERTNQLLARTRASHAPLDALQRFMERSFLRADGACGALGCMLVNTVVELAAVDDELHARASNYLDALQETFAACLREAGYAPARSLELAAFLMLLNEGVRVSSRRNLPRRKQLDQIDTAFRLLRSTAA